MTDQANIDRRILLAGCGAALSLALMRQASAEPAGVGTGFEPLEIKTSDNVVFARRYGQGSPLLMVHGFPRSSLMWRYVALSSRPITP